MRRKRVDEIEKSQCRNVEIPITKSVSNNVEYYNTTLLISINTPEEEGLYSLFFHNCYNSDYRDLVSCNCFKSEKCPMLFLSLFLKTYAVQIIDRLIIFKPSS